MLMDGGNGPATKVIALDISSTHIDMTRSFLQSTTMPEGSAKFAVTNNPSWCLLVASQPICLQNVVLHPDRAAWILASTGLRSFQPREVASSRNSQPVVFRTCKPGRPCRHRSSVLVQGQSITKIDAEMGATWVPRRRLPGSSG